MGRPVFGRRDARMWEDDEIAIVRELWPAGVPQEEVASKVGHPVSSIQHLARQIGLSWGSAVFKIEGDRPTRAELLRLLEYDPATGIVTRRISIRNFPAGEIAGCLDERGYRRIMVGGRRYRAGQLIWVMMKGEWPAAAIDHRDTYGPKADWGDRWDNLRLATKSQNAQNHRLNKRNVSGHTGVRRASKNNTGWEAYINAGEYRPETRKRREIYLGHFKNYDDAVVARQAAELKHFGEFMPIRQANRDKPGSNQAIAR